jgi:hypothetical protein
MKSSIRHGHRPSRPYFTTEEVERRAVEELERQGLLPSEPSAIRIERFVEKRFGLGAVSYDELPEGVLGYTAFGPTGVTAVVVSRTLCDEGSRVAERRINSTLAHEAGHGILHTSLFQQETSSLPLFDGSSDVTAEKILCRDEPDSGRYGGRWWEYQANQMMSALLLPRPLVLKALEEFVVRRGVMATPSLPAERHHQAKMVLAETFDVNPIVSQIRIQQLFPAAHEDQLSL